MFTVFAMYMYIYVTVILWWLLLITGKLNDINGLKREIINSFPFSGELYYTKFVYLCLALLLFPYWKTIYHIFNMIKKICKFLTQVPEFIKKYEEK